MKAERLAVLLLALALLGFVAYQIYTVISNIHYGDVELPPNDYGGGAGLGVILEYPDGRTKTISPQSLRYMFFPLSVYMSGEEIAKVTWITYVYLDWAGDLTCLELSGPMEVKANTGALVRKETMWRKTGVNWNMPAKKTWVEMWRFTVDADEIEANLGGQSGTYTLTCTSNVTAKAMFSTGTTSTKIAIAQLSITVEIQAAQLCVLKVDLQANAYK